MTIFLFILAFIFVFSLGVASALLVAAAILKHDADYSEGVWLTYSKSKNEWTSFGDLAKVYAKASTHPKPIRKVC